MRSSKIILSILVISIFFQFCNSNNSEKINRIVIGISSDIETINPLYSFSVDEGVINETLFLSLVHFEWDSSNGDLKEFPMLAESWEWDQDSTSVTILLRNDIQWSDQTALTIDDIIFSFDLYSDPQVQSRNIGTFKNFNTDDNGKVDLNKTFEKLAGNKLKINFLPGSVPSILDISIPIIPKHIFDKIDRTEIPTSKVNFNPVSSGPYKLKKWNRNQSIILEANKKSFLFRDGMFDEIIFKIVPDYNSKLLQLKKGEIDFSELIKAVDAREINNYKNLIIKTVKGREYDYVGWNNIDSKTFLEKNLVKPNKLFGSAKVRQALSHAINKQEILTEHLLNYGELAVSPVSSIFKTYFDSSLKAIEYDPALAKKMLAEDGWTDKDKNGVIEKGNLEFRFTLHIPSSNPLREYAANIIKNNLRAIGIEMNVEKSELGAFIENLYNRKLDAWMASWFIQVPLEFKTYWFSDLNISPLNFTGYQSEEADKVMLNLEKVTDSKIKKTYIFEFQNIIYKDQPVTFLYWMDNIVVYNNKLKNVTINPYGALQKLWEWRKS